MTSRKFIVSYLTLELMSQSRIAIYHSLPTKRWNTHHPLRHSNCGLMLCLVIGYRQPGPITPKWITFTPGAAVNIRDKVGRSCKGERSDIASDFSGPMQLDNFPLLEAEKSLLSFPMVPSYSFPRFISPGGHIRYNRWIAQLLLFLPSLKLYWCAGHKTAATQ